VLQQPEVDGDHQGCEIAVIEGNLDSEGQPFVARFHCSDGAKTPPHWHPTDENLTVLKGTFLVGTGESFDESKLQAMNLGSYMMMPKEMRHFGMAKGDFDSASARNWTIQGELGESIEVQPPDAPAANRAKTVVPESLSAHCVLWKHFAVVGHALGC